MAKEAKSEAEGAEASAAAPKKSKKLIIIIAAVFVLLLAAGGAAAFFLMKGHAQEDEDGEVVTEKAKVEKKKAGKEAVPVYVALDAFTVNLVPENGDQFLQLIISVEVADRSTMEPPADFPPKSG